MSTLKMNFFEDQAYKYAGDKSFGLPIINRRDSLPKGLEGEYLHNQTA